MYNLDDIMKFVFIVVEVTDPDKIILFGSYAYGSPTEKSDLDFLVIKNDRSLSRDEHAKLATAIFRKHHQHSIGPHYDIFIRTERQAIEAAEKGGAFVDALQKGKVVYERIHQ